MNQRDGGVVLWTTGLLAFLATRLAQWGGLTHQEVVFMPYLLVRHKVADYAKWKEAFDAGISLRRVAGEKNFRIFQSASDSNDLVMLFEWADMAKARQFMGSPVLKAGMQRCGVTEDLGHWFLEEAASGMV
jgi:antibiotic biosynthesis monooxygenase